MDSRETDTILITVFIAFLALIGFFLIVGIHSTLVGTINTHFKCIEYSEETGLCSERILISNGKKYSLRLIRNKNEM